jgi:two-component system alkaline phosphatase synthesis response regulator PhoP
VTKRIVLIEDDTDLYALLKYNLEKEGFTVAGSQTGRGALDLCRRVRPDLILLDIMLPDSDGLDICKGIRNDSELAQTPSSSSPPVLRKPTALSVWNWVPTTIL